MAIINNSDGSIYEGQLMDGQNHGEGSLTFPDGQKFETDFKK